MLPRLLLQIELLSPQQNGTAVDLEGSTSGGNAQRASIKGMWKKAFRSLKSHSKDKDERPAENKAEDRKHVQRTTSLKLGLMKRKDSKEQVQHDSPKASTQKKGLLKRKDSKDPPSDEMADNEISCELDPVYSLLKCAADLPRYGRPGNTCCIRTQLADNITLHSSSRTSSSSSDGSGAPMCTCACHSPTRLAGYNSTLLQPQHRKSGAQP
ncbi:hypothetical protein NP493_70g03017 [Ridgeia piscesae]|uniref:Uncharacterized protein n=1 Tax=Ridgeia piscesae TaxID=27915 RepID=A0AAD9UIK3_RIDPI|nr:hypothetical protein NP493_70g03017 [Ridgeia piscesae]